MKPLPEQARTQNRTGNDFCRWCADDGLVVAQTRAVEASTWAAMRGIKPAEGAVYEEMAPCPYCQHGYRMEFGEKGPWAPAGFWQGRDLVNELMPLYPHGKEAPLPWEANREEARKTMEVVNEAIKGRSRW